MSSLFEPPPNGPKKWLFCFTHPDDEISTCAWMRRLARAGAEVWAGWSVSNPVREAEARRVMAELGVADGRLFFFDMPDKGAFERIPELAEKWSSAIERASPDRIALGAFECGHIDHDATNAAVTLANAAKTPQLEIPFYHTYLARIPVLNRFADARGQDVLQLDLEECKLKRKVSRMYKSQNIASLLIWYTLLGWLKGNPPALCRTERMRLQTHFDFACPNLPEPMRSEVMKSDTWKRWSEQIAKL